MGERAGPAAGQHEPDGAAAEAAGERLDGGRQLRRRADRVHLARGELLDRACRDGRPDGDQLTAVQRRGAREPRLVRDTAAHGDHEVGLAAAELRPAVVLHRARGVEQDTVVLALGAVQPSHAVVGVRGVGGAQMGEAPVRAQGRREPP